MSMEQTLKCQSCGCTVDKHGGRPTKGLLDNWIEVTVLLCRWCRKRFDRGEALKLSAEKRVGQLLAIVGSSATGSGRFGLINSSVWLPYRDRLR